MRLAILLFTCGIAIACSRDEGATAGDSLVGARATATPANTALAAPPHPGAPAGVETADLWYLGTAEEAERDTTYRIHRARWSERGRQAEVLWLEWEYDRPRPEGDTTHLVLDRVVLPALAEGEILEHTFCRVNRQEDRWLLAVVLNDESQPNLTGVRRAWRANPVSRRLEEIPVTGIDCLNDDYGV